MGIFKNFTKTLKKAAPIIGAGIGMYFGGPMGASIGSGIGSLAAGQDTEQALLNAALAGGTAYMSGYGKGFEKLPSGGMSNISGPEMMVNQTTTTPVSAIQEAGGSGVLSQIGNFVKDNKALTAGIAGLGLAGLAGEEEKGKSMGTDMRPYATGKSRLGYGRIGDKMYNLDDEEERQQYFKDNRERQGTEDLAAGGEVEGPGTGTSDSVPARLSDGEFVLTAKAMRGAGGGDRDVGAARMYDMMSQLERVA